MLKRIIVIWGEVMKIIELVGFEDFDVDTVEEIKQKMKPVMNKYSRMFGEQKIQDFRVVSKTMKKDGGKDLHELTATLNTTDGDFRVVKSGWEILSLVDKIESTLEEQIKKQKEKRLKEREGRNV